MAAGLKRGWVPHDEGALAQSAERVLQGELPHRDFDEIYTGGLTYLNAAAFRVFGTELSSPRYVLYLFFLAWVPAVYYVATRFVRPSIAGTVVLLAVVWGVPNYSAALPSWYNLYFATFGIASMLRYIQDRSPLWLFLAGACGGLSCLFKVSGIFFVGALFLSLLFLSSDLETTTLLPFKNVWHRVFVVVSVLAYCGLVFAVIWNRPILVSLCYFVGPVLVVGAVLLWQEFGPGRTSGQSMSSLLRMLGPFVAGVAFPLLVFLVPFIRGGGVSTLIYGVFVLPARRFVFASSGSSMHRLITGSMVDLLIIGAIFQTTPKARRIAGVALVLAAAIVLIAAPTRPAIYRTAWIAAWALVPVIVVAGGYLLARGVEGHETTTRQRACVFLVLSAVVAGSMVQFPFGGAIYFCYVAPLLVLATAAVLSIAPRPTPLVLAGIGLFFAMYAVFEVGPVFVYAMGNRYVPDVQTVPLTLPRAGQLRVSGRDAHIYADLVALVREHAEGPYIYCTPDCPEVYFLGGLRNPGRTLFDFFDRPTGRTARVLAVLKEHHVNLVVLNRQPSFSGPVPADLNAAFVQEFPNHAAVQRFDVRWR